MTCFSPGKMPKLEDDQFFGVIPVLFLALVSLVDEEDGGTREKYDIFSGCFHVVDAVVAKDKLLSGCHRVIGVVDVMVVIAEAQWSRHFRILWCSMRL